MAVRLVDLYFTKEFVASLTDALVAAHSSFDRAAFSKAIYQSDWEEKALKERMRRITESMRVCLPAPYEVSLEILRQVAPRYHGFDGMVFPDFVECYGLEAPSLSLDTLEHFTQFSSSEFAIRPFLLADLEPVMQRMNAWAGHENHHVRRFASEGCRPRLPWAMAVPALKENPDLIVPVLDNLKKDPSEYVRKSVANNLNDISKDHPDLVLDLAERWYGETKETDWVVKHACRTLLKSGNRQAMRIFGFMSPDAIEVSALRLTPASLAIGNELAFSFDLRLGNDAEAIVRLEFAIDYVKKSGKTSRKVFQIKEAGFSAGVHRIEKRHSFQERTTRKHYPGTHMLTVLVNGERKASASFELKE